MIGLGVGAHALEGFLEFRRTVGIHLDELALDAPRDNLRSLYEAWGTLQVIKALADTAIELGYTVTEHLSHAAEARAPRCVRQVEVVH